MAASRRFWMLTASTTSSHCPTHETTVWKADTYALQSSQNIVPASGSMITCLCLQTLEFPPAARCKRARKAPRLTIFSSIGPSFPGEVEHDAKARDGQDIESPLAAEIGRASCRKKGVSTCKSRWSPYHEKKKNNHHRTNES